MYQFAPEPKVDTDGGDGEVHPAAPCANFTAQM